jgi:hypothetical protein
MRKYLSVLLDYMDGGGGLVPTRYKPVEKDVVEALVEYFSIKHPRQTEPQRVVNGTNISMIRASLVLERIVQGNWQMMLGRAMLPGEMIDAEHCLKTPGGYAKLSAVQKIRDKSILKSLLREIREEGLNGRFRIDKSGVFPVCVLSAQPEGVLQFFSGRLLEYPPADERQLRLLTGYVGKEGVNKNIFITYMGMRSLTDELAKGASSVVKPETVEAAANAYFWEPVTKVDFRRTSEPRDFVLKGGDLAIPENAKAYMLERSGLALPNPDESLNRCRVYFSVPTQADVLPAVRIILWTDLFMYQKEFGPSRFRSYIGRNEPFTPVAERFVKKYVCDNYATILESGLFEDYVIEDSDE